MYVGIDLGGTNIAAALVETDGTITKRVGVPTDGKNGAKGVISGLASVCELLLSDTAIKPRSIGIGVPGTVNDTKGEVVFTPNLPLRDVDIVDELKKNYDCPVRLGNDANCAALGETVAGGAKGARDVVLITLGTGLGGGVIVGGRLHTGLCGAAGELGHMVIEMGGRQCGCGRRGCWETYASATGLINTAYEYELSHKDSLLWAGVDEMSQKRIDGAIIFKAYREGDTAAMLTVQRYVEHLAAGVVNIINILEPESICVGGGISNAWDCIYAPLQEAVDKEKFTRFSPQSPQTKLVKAMLGNDAGIIGAAALGW